MSKLGLEEITVLFLYEMRTFRTGEKGISLWNSRLCRSHGFYCLSESHHFRCLVFGLLVHIVYSFEISVLFVMHDSHYLLNMKGISQQMLPV